MFGEAENIFEFFRGASLPLIVTVIPMLILMSSPMIVMASQEFTVYRMNHYDFQGAQHGSRNSLFNLETRVAKDITGSISVFLSSIEIYLLIFIRCVCKKMCYY